MLLLNSALTLIKKLQNAFNPPKSPLQLTLKKINATMNYHDSQWHNNETNHLDSYFSFFKITFRGF